MTDAEQNEQNRQNNNLVESRKAALNNAVFWANEKLAENENSHDSLTFYGAVITIIVISISLWAFKMYYDHSGAASTSNKNNKNDEPALIDNRRRVEPAYETYNEQSYEPEHLPRSHSERRHRRRHRSRPQQRPPLKNPGIMSGGSDL
jgi:hypothetical protein